MPTKKASKKTTKKKVAKKATTKKVAKKTAKKSTSTSKKTTKKASSNKSGKKALVYAPDHESFWVTNGQILNSLLALRDALAEMEKEVYRYHTDKVENDFANWVDAVLCDSACAKDLAKAKTPQSAKTVVVKHLKLYTI
jgi:hypothetical protein